MSQKLDVVSQKLDVVIPAIAIILTCLLFFSLVKLSYKIFFLCDSISFLIFAIFLYFLFVFSFDTSYNLIAIVSKKVFTELKFTNKIGNKNVAILYTVKNDFDEENIKTLLNQSYKCDVWVLDASTNKRIVAKIDKVSKNLGFKVFRRGKVERNFKSGKAIDMNEWIKKFGHQYDYVSIADSDSKYPPQFIENMLKYAEHPENRNIGIFQSIPVIIKKNFFTKLMNYISFPLMKRDMVFMNSTNTVFSWGHNNLIRVNALKKVGGFDEKYISEDYATATKLYLKNYKTIFVPVISYEESPLDIYAWFKREIKWTSGSIEFFKMKIPNFSSWFERLRLLIGHLTPLVMGFGLILILLISFIFRVPFIFSKPFIYFLLIFIISQIQHIVFAKYWDKSLSIKNLIIYNFLRSGINALMFIPSIFGLFNKKWITTPKKEQRNLAIKVLLITTFLIFLILLIINPYAYLWNIFWMPNIVVSILLLLILERKKSNS